MVRFTLSRKLTALFASVIVAVVALVGGVLAQYVESVLVEEARGMGVALAKSIAATSTNDFYNYNYVGLEQKAEEAATGSNIAYIVLFDKEGKVASFTGQGLPTSGDQIRPLEPASDQVETVIEELQGGKLLQVTQAVRMPDMGLRWGTVRLGLSLEYIRTRINRIYLITVLLGLGGIFAGWAVSHHFTGRITGPLKELLGATVKVADGDLDTSISVDTGDEVQDLAENFNTMVNQIRQHQDYLFANLKEIERLKQYQDLIILSMTNGLVSLDAKGQIVTFNRKAEELFGTLAERATGSIPEDIWGSENEIARLLSEGLENGAIVQDREFAFEGGDGESKVLDVSTALIQEADGTVVGLLAVFQDLTEKKVLEAAVRRSDRLAALGTLASGLAHEIKNPLTAVKSFVQSLPDKHRKENFMEKFNRVVPKELGKLDGIIDNLLDLARKPPMRLSPVNIASSIDHVLEVLEPFMEGNGIELDLSELDTSVHVKADEAHIGRVFHNIVLNALQAMPQGGKLSVEASLCNSNSLRKRVQVRISDTGPGIPEEMIEEIFDPFFTRKEKGTGLGLAVSNKIMEDHGGDITVESEPGKGTVFIVTLPAEDHSRNIV